jgi:hypothetical protein
MPKHCMIQQKWNARPLIPTPWNTKMTTILRQGCMEIGSHNVDYSDDNSTSKLGGSRYTHCRLLWRQFYNRVCSHSVDYIKDNNFMQDSVEVCAHSVDYIEDNNFMQDCVEVCADTVDYCDDNNFMSGLCAVRFPHLDYSDENNSMARLCGCRFPHCRLQVKVKVKFTLEQAMKVQRGSRGIALLFL